MLAFAPITRIVDWFTTDRVWRDVWHDRPSRLGLAVLDAIRSQEGIGEIGGNNAGPHVEKYRGKRKGKGPWCAALVSWCIATACSVLAIVLPLDLSNGARRLFRNAVAAGWRVAYDDVQPGDLVLWARGPEGSWKAHIGVVDSVERDTEGKVVSWLYWAGNEGKYPARVALRAGHRKRLIGFARLP